jgi:hypothetical protein
VNLIKFIESFPDESSCRIRFKEFRDDQGVICRKCGGTDHYWLQTIEQYQCKKCNTRTTLRSGTVMQASNLPFRYWFIAIHLLTSTKKTFSAKELQRQIGHKFYEPIWFMMQKLRLAMGSRDSRHKLDSIVELGEGFFDCVDTEREEGKRPEPKKRVRGSQKKRKVLVMASTVNDFSRTKKYGKPTKFRYVKMIVIDGLKGQTVGEKVSGSIKYDTVVKTDNYSSYSKIKDHVGFHILEKVSPMEAGKVPPWVHIMIANAKRTLLGIHHMISNKYSQNYLDEFCYKVNRRNYGNQLFDRLLIACVTTNYQNIIKHYR